MGSYIVDDGSFNGWYLKVISFSVDCLTDARDRIELDSSMSWLNYRNKKMPMHLSSDSEDVLAKKLLLLSYYSIKILP